MGKSICSINLEPQALLSIDQNYLYQAFDMGVDAILDAIDSLNTPNEPAIFKAIRTLLNISDEEIGNDDDDSEADVNLNELTHKELVFAGLIILLTIFSLIAKLITEIVRLKIDNQELNYSLNMTPETSNKPPRTEWFDRSEWQKDKKSRRTSSHNDDRLSVSDNHEESQSNDDSKSQAEEDSAQNTIINGQHSADILSNTEEAGSEKSTGKSKAAKETEEDRAARLNKEKSLDGILSEKKRKKGRKGHVGHGCKLPVNTLVEDIDHYPKQCQECSHLSECLANKNLTCFSTRHEFDIEVVFKHKRHKGYKANNCLLEPESPTLSPKNSQSTEDSQPIEQTTLPETAPDCLENLSLQQACFPYGINSSMQYGPNIKAIALFQHCFCFTSVGKSVSMLNSYLALANVPRSISKGTLENWITEAGNALTETTIGIKRKLFLENLVCTDETGTHVDGELWWIHVACNDVWSYFYASAYRGQEGMKAGDFLEWYEGIVESDFWKSYWKIGSDGLIHAVCCAHLCRELLAIYLFYETNTEWAGDLITLLINMKRDRDALIKEGKDSFPAEKKQLFYAALNNLLTSAAALNPIVKEKGKKGRPAKGKVRALIDRITDNKEAVCRFVENFDVPFTNNMAERSFRPLQQMNAISGGFRGDLTIIHFMKIWGFLSSCIKQKKEPLDALISLFKGKPTEVLFPDGIPEEPEYVKNNREAAAELQAKLAELEAAEKASDAGPSKKASAKKEAEKTQREKAKEKKRALWNKVDDGCDYSQLALKYLPEETDNQVNQIAV